jgi:hypothetical protein
VVPTAATGADAWTVARAGAGVHRLRAALAARGLATAWVAADRTTVAHLVELPPGEEPLGLLAVGVTRASSSPAP